MSTGYCNRIGSPPPQDLSFCARPSSCELAAGAGTTQTRTLTSVVDVTVVGWHATRKRTQLCPWTVLRLDESTESTLPGRTLTWRGEPSPEDYRLGIWAPIRFGFSLRY